MPDAGVLIAGFGAPDSIDAVGPFIHRLTGQEMPDAVLTRVKARYEAIGGASPLGKTAEELAQGVSAALARAGTKLPIEVGMRYTDPLIEDAVGRLIAQGVRRIILVALSPHVARVTHEEYRKAASRAAGGRAVLIDARPLSALPVYTQLHADAAAEAIAKMPASSVVVFSAHSLPCADVAEDDAYVRGVETSAQNVANALGLASGTYCEVLSGITTLGARGDVSDCGAALVDDIAYGRAGTRHVWLVAYQSEGARGGEWLQPTLGDVIDAAAAAGHEGVTVIPVGFATDHMETLYDLDIVIRGQAADAGIAYARSAVPNAHHALAEAIADEVRLLAAGR